MEIPNPVANRGAKVMARNYRCKQDEVWEEGKILSLEYANSFGSFSWSYRVRLDREGKRGGIILHVGDNSIKTIF